VREREGEGEGRERGREGKWEGKRAFQLRFNSQSITDCNQLQILK